MIFAVFGFLFKFIYFYGKTGPSFSAFYGVIRARKYVASSISFRSCLYSNLPRQSNYIILGIQTWCPLTMIWPVVWIFQHNKGAFHLLKYLHAYVMQWQAAPSRKCILWCLVTIISDKTGWIIEGVCLVQCSRSATTKSHADIVSQPHITENSIHDTRYHIEN